MATSASSHFSMALRKEHVKWERKNVTTWTPYHENGQVYSVFETGFKNMIEVFRACWRRHSQEVLLVDEHGSRLTFDQVFSAAEILSRALRNPSLSGLSRGDRVGVCSRNSFEWVISYIAACFAGMIVIPMNSWWTPKELEYAIKHADCKLIFADAERIERLRQIPKQSIAQLKIVSINDEPRPNIDISDGFAAPFHQWMDKGQSLPRTDFEAVAPSPDEPGMIMYTSGTTSFPKGVVLTHRGIAHSCSVTDKLYHASQRKNVQVGGEAKRAILLCVPLFHATGLYAVFFGALMDGRKVVIMRKWNAEKALELVERERVTHFTGVPTMILEMLASPDLKKRNVSSLKSIGSGGAPPPAGVAKSVKETFKAAPSQGFGLTEVNAVATTIGPKDFLTRPTSCGRAVPGVEIQIWAEDKDEALPPEKFGRIVIRGPGLMLEYWKDYEATNKAITKDGWFKCGDFGHMDKDGFLFISGRSQDLLIRGGENISAGTVEQAVFASFESIQECAVFGFPHPTLGEEVGLAIYMKEGQPAPTLEEIRQRCSSLIAQFMLPTGLTVFRKTKLPRGATGKTVKKDIKDMLKNGKLENWTVWSKAKL